MIFRNTFQCSTSYQTLALTSLLLRRLLHERKQYNLFSGNIEWMQVCSWNR